MKTLKIIILIITILLSGFYLYENISLFKSGVGNHQISNQESKQNSSNDPSSKIKEFDQSWSDQNKMTVIKDGSLDGSFNLVQTEFDRYSDGEIIISSSTNDVLNFQIHTVNLAHLGDYSGIAKRVASSSVVYYSDKEVGDQNGLCLFTIIFTDSNHVIYQTEDPKDKVLFGCSSNHGAHGTFFDGEIHKRDWKIEPPTIEELGFNKDDRKVFDSLINGLIPEVERSISPENVRKLSSSEIKNSLVYSIDSPNIYSATPCDYTNPSGYCTFAVFMKDDSGHYWLLGGNTSDLREPDAEGFIYATNNEFWKSKLPDVFKSEIERIGLNESQIKFEK